MTEKINTINVFPDEKTYTENKTQLTESDLAMVPINLVELPIASSEEASAGVDDSKLMTPKKVKESITINAPQADWNASSGTSQILNKPVLSTVATTGSYNDLSNKPSIPPRPIVYVSSSWYDNTFTNWYRVWSDGRIEQGGIVSGAVPTISFHKSFMTTTYSIFSFTNDGYANFGLIVGTANKSKTSVYLQWRAERDLPKSLCWYATGY